MNLYQKPAVTPDQLIKNLLVSPGLKPFYPSAPSFSRSLYAVAIIIQAILQNIRPDFNFPEKLGRLFSQYSQCSLDLMGFEENWEYKWCKIIS